MPRTRDFVLVLITIVFLVMVIGTTVFTQGQAAAQQKTQLQPAVVQDGEYSAVVFDPHEFSRSQKLQQMRDKIAASSQLTITEPKPVQVIEEVSSSTATSTLEESVRGLQVCQEYAPAGIQWSPAGIQIEEVEGARLVYRASEEPITTMPDSSPTSTPILIDSRRDVLLQLPVRNLPTVSTSCISSDVIGIANDGSLIRNTEAGVYGIFNSSTLVGYALDGFPIYGSSPEVGDVCGGVMTAEGYRYYISKQRETILNCYSAPPVSFE